MQCGRRGLLIGHVIPSLYFSMTSPACQTRWTADEGLRHRRHRFFGRARRRHAVRARRLGAGHRARPPAARGAGRLDVETVGANMLDRASMRRALDGCDVLFHTAGMVASRPQRQVWRVNAVGPRIAVETPAECGVGRVVRHLERRRDRPGPRRPPRRTRAIPTRAPARA